MAERKKRPNHSRTPKKELEYLAFTNTIRSVKPKDLAEATTLYDEEIKHISDVDSSPYYYHTVKPYPHHEQQKNRLQPVFLHFFYPNSGKACDMFYEKQEILHKKGREIAIREPATEEIIATGGELLQHTNGIISAFDKFITTEPNPLSITVQTTMAQKLALLEVFEKVGKEKPEPVKEVLRRYIPRWTWQPHDYPYDIAPNDEELQQGWSEYLPGDASYLTTEERIQKDQAPFHMAWQAAEQHEDPDVRYGVEAKLITDTLAMEEERSMQEEHAEIPFFTYAFAAALATKAEPPSKYHHFDYHGAIATHMKRTFERLGDEHQTGEEGSATAFLQQVSSHYGNHFPELLVRSIITQNTDSANYDDSELIKGLYLADGPWHQQVQIALDKMPERTAYTAQDVQGIARVLPEYPPDQDKSPEAFIDDISFLLDEDDRYSFKEGRLHVQIDSVAEQIDAAVQAKLGKTVRTVPFQLSLSGETESMQFNLIDPENSDPAVAALYRDTVVQAIIRKAERKRSKTTDTVVAETEEGATKFAISTLTREERMAQYANTREEKTASKKRGKKKSVEAPSTDQALDAEVGYSMNITNLTVETIQHFLDAEKIRSFDAAGIFQELHRSVYVAEQNHKLLGKKTKGATERNVKLHQIGWRIDDIPLRVYLEKFEENTFKIRGIYVKTDPREQTRFMDRMITAILKERNQR